MRRLRKMEALLAIVSLLVSVTSPVSATTLGLALTVPKTVTAIPYQEFGVVVPESPFRFEGEYFQLNCTITNPDLQQNASNLFFERKTSKGIVTLGTDLVQLVDSKTISLTLNTVSMEDEGIYTCRMYSVDTGKFQSTLIGHQWLKVDFAPQAVQNFTCEIYNWQEMNCTWDLGVNYRHQENVQVDVRHSKAHVNYQCFEATKTSCHWNTNDYGHKHHYWVQVKVSYVIKRVVESEDSKLFLVETNFRDGPIFTTSDAEVDYTYVQALVRPAPVQNLTGWPESDSCILLSWRYPWAASHAENMDKTFMGQIKLRDSGEIWDDIILNVISDDLGDRFSHESLVCDLRPHHQYSFRVAVKPIFINPTKKLQIGHTSKWRETSISTEQGVPDAASEVCTGCYFDVSQGKGSRTVEIIWKDIAKAHRHGKLTYYKVTYTGLVSRVSHSILSQMSKMGTPLSSAQLTLPSAVEDFLIELRGATVAGLSPMSSSMIIPAIGKVPKTIPDQIQKMWVERDVSRKETPRLFLSWSLAHKYKKVATPPSFKLYFVWCKGSRLDHRCQESIGWIELPLGSLTYKHDSDMADFDPNDLLFGIATEVKDAGRNGSLSSGISWNSCLYSKDQRPSKPPRNLRAFLNHRAQGLTVVWDKQGCQEDPSRLMGHMVRYRCVTSGEKLCQGTMEDRVMVKSDATEAILPDLESGQKYLVHVTPISMAGQGPTSNVTFTYSSTGKSDSLTGPIIIVSVVAVVIILGILFLAVALRCRRKMKKLPDIRSLLNQPEQRESRSSEEDQNQLPNASESLPFEENPNIPLLDHPPSVTNGQNGDARTCLNLQDETNRTKHDSGFSISKNNKQRSVSSSTASSVSNYQIVGVEDQNILRKTEKHLSDDGSEKQMQSKVSLLTNHDQRVVQRGRNSQIPPEPKELLVLHAQNESGHVSLESKISCDECESQPILYAPPKQCELGYVPHSRVSEYVTQAAIESPGSEYVTQAAIESTGSEYVTQAAIESTGSEYVTQAAIKSPGSEYVTQAAIKSPGSEFVTQAAIESTGSEYVTQAAIKSTGSEYVTQAAIESTGSEYVTQAAIKSPGSEYVTQAAIESPGSEYVTQAAIESTGSEYVAQAAIKSTGSEYVTQAVIESPGSEYVTQAAIESPGSEYVTQAVIESPGSENATEAVIESPGSEFATQAAIEPRDCDVEYVLQAAQEQCEPKCGNQNTSEQCKPENVHQTALEQCESEYAQLAASEPCVSKDLPHPAIDIREFDSTLKAPKNQSAPQKTSSMKNNYLPHPTKDALNYLEDGHLQSHNTTTNRTRNVLIQHQTSHDSGHSSSSSDQDLMPSLFNPSLDNNTPHVRVGMESSNVQSDVQLESDPTERESFPYISVSQMDKV